MEQNNKPPFEVDKQPKKSAVAGKHGAGYSTARHLARMAMQKVIKQSPEMKKYTKEEVDQLDELSPATVASYKEKASKEIPALQKHSKSGEYKDIAANILKRRTKGMAMASVREEEILEAKATMCGRCGTRHVPPSQGGTCPALKEEEVNEAESHTSLAKYANIHAREAEMAQHAKAKAHHQSAADYYSKAAEAAKSGKHDHAEYYQSKAEEHADTAEEYERSESVNEVSNELLQRYKQKAGAQVDNPETPSSIKYKRGKGHLMATVKQMKSGKPMPPVQKEETMKSFQSFRAELVEKKLTPAEMKKREEVAKAIERDQPGMPMAKKMAIATATAKKVAEAAPEGMHYCAKHVYSDVFGEGLVIEGEHADPSADGSIEWYNVKFDHGVEKVFTEDVQVMFAEYHMNHKRKKKKMMEQEIEEKKALHPNQQVLDVHEPEKDELTAKDFEMLRKIKKNRTK